VPFYYGATGDGGGHGDCWKGRADDLARAAILSALDLEDEAMVEAIETKVFYHGPIEMHSTDAHRIARLCIHALRSMVLPNEPTPEEGKEGKCHE
jgi:hypothetical protein